MKYEFNQNRSFGIEIETISKKTLEVTSHIIAGVIGAEKVDTEEHGYHRHDGQKWGTERDGSLRPRNLFGRGYQHGVEVISRPLKGDAGLAELKKVLDSISPDIKVNSSCGIHVHIDMRDLSWKEVKTVTSIYARFEDMIDGFMPKSRRKDNNDMTLSVKKYINILNSKRTDFIYNHNLRSNHSRYHKVNLESYLRRGIIEFRHHGGSFEYEKIKNWIVFLMGLVTYGSKSTVKRSLTKNVKGEKMFTMLMGKVGLIPYRSGQKKIEVDSSIAKVVNYFRKRLTQFIPTWKEIEYAGVNMSDFPINARPGLRRYRSRRR